MRKRKGKKPHLHWTVKKHATALLTNLLVTYTAVVQTRLTSS